MAGSASRRVYASHVRRYLLQVTVSDMTSAPSGARAQVVDRQGGLVDDFALQRRVGSGGPQRAVSRRDVQPGER